MNRVSPSCDIFCKIVDNFGDIGVCWRLAKQLHATHGFSVRLWVDDLAPLRAMEPQTASLEHQIIDGIDVLHWTKNTTIDAVADLVIEAFACELPPEYIDAMARRTEQPVWLNLEYLSAEKWVEETHLLPSPHPHLPLTKYFFFPGFSAQTGGLLREVDLLARRARYFDHPDSRLAIFAKHNIQDLRKTVPARRSDAGSTGCTTRRCNTAGAVLRKSYIDARPYSIIVSLFTYENAALDGLLRCWESGPQPVLCLIPEGRVLQSADHHAGHRLRVGEVWKRGNLVAQVIPFMSPSGYDELLWACDVNFVRGEDSFVRAQWAAKPFVWHIYPQENHIHQAKLNAFLSRYLAGAPEELTMATRAFWLAWNEEKTQDICIAWSQFAAVLPQCHKHAEHWLNEQSHRSLVDEIVLFYRKKAKMQGFFDTQSLLE